MGDGAGRKLVFTLGRLQGDASPPVCIQLAKLIKTGGLSLPFSNLEIQALQRQKKKKPLKKVI